MATPTLDVGLLQYFSPIFSFILIFTLVYAVLQFTKLLGNNKVVHATLALVVGAFFLFTPNASGVIMFITPWFTVLFIIIVFMLISFKIFGATDDQIRGVISNWGGLQWLIGIIGIVIIIAAFGNVFGQKFLGFTQGNQAVLPTNQNGELPTGTGDFEQNVAGVFFHPKILGMILILIIAGLTIRALSGVMKPDWPPANGGHNGGGHH